MTSNLNIHDEEEIKRLKAEVELLRAESFEARAEAEGAKRKLAEESKEIELIKQEVTMAISKARAEADVEKANLVGKSEAVDKMKQKYEILQVEAEEMRRRVKEEADRTRLEAEADASSPHCICRVMWIGKGASVVESGRGKLSVEVEEGGLVGARGRSAKEPSLSVNSGV